MTMTADSCARARRTIMHQLAAAALFTVLSLTATGWTGQVWGQERLPRVGILTFFPINDLPTGAPWFTASIHRRLADRGWVEGKTVIFEYRNANSDPTQLPEAARQLVDLKVDVIYANSAPTLRAAYSATRTIPIVGLDFTNDPVAAGYVESYARPSGNITGVFLDAPEFAGKWFELLTAIFPGLSRVTVLRDPAPGATHLQAVRNVAGSLNTKLQVLEVRKPEDIDKAFDKISERPQAAIILPSPMIYNQSARLARLALKHRLPATSMAREFAAAGGTLAYGPDLTSAWESVAALLAKILAGAKPGDLPIERPTKFYLVVNVKTAKTLGLDIPQSILLRADEVIE